MLKQHVEDALQPSAANIPFYCGPEEKYKNVPAECSITQVNLLERHGATERILAALRKVQVVKKQEWRNAKLRFIESYKYDLGVADVLPFGAH